MYIPKPALEDCLTSEISASGGDVMYDYITGSQIRRVHYFGWNSGSYEFEIYQGCTDSTQLFMVGGGGSGGFIPSQSVAQNPPNFPAGGMLGGAGGGGAGGVLFINPNRELTGSLELVPGKYSINIGEGGHQLGFIDSTDFNNQGIFSNGGDTTFKYAFQLANDADIPSGSASSSRYDYDSIQIKAGGGGFGSYSEWIINPLDDCGQVGTHYEIRTFHAGDGGSGGGAGYSADGSICSPALGDTGSVEFPFRNQGNVGGQINFNANSRGGGGGGAGSAGNYSVTGSGGLKTEEFIRGYEEDYAPGGAGQFTFENSGNLSPQLLFISGSQRNFVKGVGGNGLTANIPLTDYDLTYPPYNQQGWIDDLRYTSGTGGEAIITYALTGSQLTQGKLHYIDGGATGGDFTFIPCGEVRLETLTVPAGKQACICATDTGLPTFIAGRDGELWWREVTLPVSSSDEYNFSPEKQMKQLPSGSGTVTFTTGSECKSYVEFEGWDNCSSCQQSAPAGIYIGFDISGSSGRTNPLPYYKYPDTTVHYTSSQDYITSSRYNNHDSESYFKTRFGAFSNDFDDDIPYSTFVPSASFSTSYDDQNVDFTTGSECYTKYDCDPLDPSTVTATGGIEGTFISGSGIGNEFIYKYHIFESSGSTNETTQRSFQKLNVSSGFTEDVNVLVIGPGGPGGRGIPDSLGSKPYYYGGGGGGGQVKEGKINGICSQYTLNIAPGFAQPNFTNLPDDWQAEVGQTILSASDGSIQITSGIGGRGAQGDNFAEYSTSTGWTERSGSGGGGAGVFSGLVSGGVSYQSNDGGWGFFGTGSAGGGGGAGEDGFNGSSTATPTEGEGGDGILSYILGVQKYFGGGGAGYGPRGAADGGLGGGADSGIGNSTGSYYGGGGGAWLEPRETYTTPWGQTYTLSGRGGDGAVIINYKWKANTSPVDYITYRGLAQYYDMYDLDSYDGTGSLVYNLWKNDNTASLENITGWEFDTDNLDSGSLLIVSSSVHPYVEADEETTNELTAMTVWEVNNQTYDSGGLIPILTDEQFGTSSIGIYAGNDTLYGEAVVIKIGDSIVTTESGSAGGFIPRGGFHISQFSYNQGTNQVLWYVDGVSGSATVNETIDDKSLTLNFNSSSLVSYPDLNPTYPSASTVDVYGLTVGNPLGIKLIEYTHPVSQETVSTTTSNLNYVVASTTAPNLTGDITASLIGTATYYPSSSLYPGRTSNYNWTIPSSSQWDKIARLSGIGTSCDFTGTSYDDISSTQDNQDASSIIMENSLVIYNTFYTDVTQSFNSFNDCIDRPDVGLGNNSVYNVTAIYTASLDWDEMRHNDNFLYPRY